jgi:hypothetical protein
MHEVHMVQLNFVYYNFISNIRSGEKKVVKVVKEADVLPEYQQ